MSTKDTKIYRLKDVVHLTGLSRSTILRLENSGKFPRRIMLTERAIGWRIADVHGWLDQRIVGTGGVK
ncbi:MAG: AlpA family phage regulatory protein [Pseudobdellovibrionaceae bacterium]|mgnify:CR=1 FL=1|nr:AlpA family phage regulatory protein [Bdellovibrionales bacterium]USN47107.1 MAG: AlpA family phage regulatory protein [Pseudobdellovibrionaceae bacterium]